MTGTPDASSSAQPRPASDCLWHPFTPMSAQHEEGVPLIDRAEGFHLIDVDGQRYLDGISSLWCNVHGHRVPEIDRAIQEQLHKVAHSTLLGLSSVPAAELARRLVEITPAGLNKVFYSDSGSTAVEAALKIAFQYHQQKRQPEPQRNLFATVSNAYHGDTIGSVSVGSIELFHRVYGALLFPTVTVPSPAALHRPAGTSIDEFHQSCFDAAEDVIHQHADTLAAFVVEPLVQGAAGILVHPPGYLRHLRELTARHGILLIADEVAVGFGRTGSLFACEQEQVRPDLMCRAKGVAGGDLPGAPPLATDEIYQAFLGCPAAGRTFFHGHTYTGNALGCAAALASLDLFQSRNLLEHIARGSERIREKLAPLQNHPHVAEVRQKGIMVGIELVRDRQTGEAFPPERRTGHRVTLAARQRGVILRPLGDVVVLMPAPAMPLELIDELCEVAIESIQAATID